MVGSGFIVTGKQTCAPGPQAFDGVQQMFPDVGPAVTVMVWVPCPAVITVPGGTVQLKPVHPEPTKLYCCVVPAHIDEGPVIDAVELGFTL